MPDGVLPVELRDVGLAVGSSTLLDGLSLTLGAEGRTAIMGPNGSGKSLTLRLVQGLLTPTSGEIRWGGRTGLAPPPGRVALLFQSPVLLRRSVRANLLHALRVYGVPRVRRELRVRDLLALAGLEALADRPARVLSGGEQQRLALVRALAAEPELLLLDEPTASLDPTRRRQSRR